MTSIQPPAFVLAPSLPARLSIQVPLDVRDATARAAAALGLTVADYIRVCLAERLLDDGEQIDPVPIRSRNDLAGLSRKAT